MVDSGSDVVTVREEVLHQLDLELLGTIQSRGVHATKQKQLYKAVLKIGDVDVEIEVRYGIKKSSTVKWQLRIRDLRTSGFGDCPPPYQLTNTFKRFS